MLCTLVITDNTDSRGVARYPVGILPIMYRASVLDRGSQNTTGAAYLGTQIMEVLKLYRQIQLDGGTIPAALADFTPQEDPYEIDGTGFWQLLGTDGDRWDMSYTLTNDPATNRLIARVTVRSEGPLGDASGGDKWIEFLSIIE